MPEILYSDNHLLAVNKPAGWLTQASEQTDTRINLEDWARDVVRVEKQKTGQVFLHALHRLDRVVSGVVLLARTSKALERLQELVEKLEAGDVSLEESVAAFEEGQKLSVYCQHKLKGAEASLKKLIKSADQPTEEEE